MAVWGVCQRGEKRERKVDVVLSTEPPHRAVERGASWEVSSKRRENSEKG
jgi:hypothetical protein